MAITSWKRERERFGSGTRGEVASTSDAAEISCEMFWEAKGRGERRTANGALNKNIHWTERGSAGGAAYSFMELNCKRNATLPFRSGRGH